MNENFLSVRAVSLLLLVAAVQLMATQQAIAQRTTTYYHHDALGSVVAASDEQGDLLWRKSYAAYGTQIDTDQDSERLSYTGKQHDDDIGLTYFGARYYDPQIGRFTGVDPISPLAAVEGNPMMFNRYAYANSNPYKFVDPDGNSPRGMGDSASALADLILQLTGVTDAGARNRLALADAKRTMEGGSSTRRNGKRTFKGNKNVTNNAPKYSRNKYKSLSQSEKNRVKTENPTCVYCDEKPSTTVDHIRSQKQDWGEGGWKDTKDVRSARVNDPNNLTGACSSCNPSKGSKELGTEWIPPKDR